MAETMTQKIEAQNMDELFACEDCGYEYRGPHSDTCPRCGAVRGRRAGVVPEVSGDLFNPYGAEYRQLNELVRSGQKDASAIGAFVESCEGRAADGDAMAQYFLAVNIYNGRDNSRVLRLLQSAAKEGNPLAEYDLALVYGRGEIVPRDIYAAIRYCRRAAEKGHVAAAHMLSRHYELGKDYGLVKDDQKALAWLRWAADNGHAPAQLDLAGHYWYGVGVERDLGHALMWYRLAAEWRHAPAEHAVGDCFANGFGVRQDPEEAVRWYTRASNQGYMPATLSLAIHLCNGYGVPQNRERSFFLTAQLVEDGFQDAYWQLSFLYRNGFGTTQNLDLADKWLLKALDSGAEFAWNGLKPETAEREFQQRATWAGDDSERVLKVLHWTVASGYRVGAEAMLEKAEALGVQGIDKAREAFKEKFFPSEGGVSEPAPKEGPGESGPAGENVGVLGKLGRALRRFFVG